MQTPNPADEMNAETPAPPRKKSDWLYRFLRTSLWTLAGLILLILLATGSGLYWLHHAMVASLPQIDGSLKLSGLAGPVTVRRDTHGVPHIEAATQDDLILTQGYITAQDRLWQMDMLRRNAAGELAEVLGSPLLEHDKAQRVYQFRNVAHRIYSSLPESDRHRYDQYALGVNLFIDQVVAKDGYLPAEFRFLHYQPRRWAGVDCILIGLNMVQSLDSRWQTKLSREHIASRLHDPRLESQLYPTGSWRDHPPTAAVIDMTEPHPAPPLPDDEENDQTQTRLASPENFQPGSSKNWVFQLANHLPGFPTAPANQRDPTCPACIPGSNSWAISGKHTASGKPLLSNDMHLGLSVPNVWYMADLKAPGLHVAGVTLPGVPLVIAGHNDHVAWGFTSLYADVQDLYIERLDGKGNYAAAHGQWLPLAHASETIHVRFAQDVNLDVQLTAHGPLLNPILPAAQHESRPISLRWSLYDPALASIPVYEINTAQNWQQFSSALSAWCWPTQNLVYADDAGHIAYHAIGKVPLRPGGLIGTPIPTPPTEDAPGISHDVQAHEWQGYIPFEELPYSVDPPSGLLATANARVTPNDTKFPLTLEWPDPYRIERVYQDLHGREKLTRDDMLTVQNDIYSEVDQELAHRFAYAIDHTSSADARLKQAADLLRSWDGRMTTDSPAASIIESARRAFWPLILEPKIGIQETEYDWSESNFAQEEIIMHGSSPEASPTQSTWLPKGFKDWDALLTEAVRRGLDNGHAPASADTLPNWTYGSWHVIDLEHPIFGLLPIVSHWTGTGAQPLSGGPTTIKQVGRAFGPSQRFTMDWSAPDSSTENIVLGQSGNPASPWFRDQWPTWYSGATFPLPFTPQAIAAQTTHTLQLEPR